MRTFIRGFCLAALTAATASCGDVARQGSSPVYLVIDILQGQRGGSTLGPPSNPLISAVVTNVTPCAQTSCPTVFADAGQVTLRAPLKDIGATAALAPTSNNEVTINRYRVDYSRADNNNTPGIDVPYGFDSAITGTITPGATLQLGFELVRIVAKEESPLIQLRTSNNVMSVIATITFFGVDRVGNNIQVQGQMQIEFGNFANQ
jgi:hypothetical protein